MWLLELSATPETSPRYMLVGSRSGLGTESKAMTGTACCASAGDPVNNISPISQCRMISSPKVFVVLKCFVRMLVYRTSRRPVSRAHSTSDLQSPSAWHCVGNVSRKQKEHKSA